MSHDRTRNFAAECEQQYWTRKAWYERLELVASIAIATAISIGVFALAIAYSSHLLQGGI